MSYSVAVDIGGTFTDLVGYDAETGAVVFAKSPTTYGNFVDGVLDCLAKAKLEPRRATFLNHGTTLVINSLIERKGAKAALVTTSGFRDVLEIARGNRPDPFDLHYRRDEPLIPRPLRFEVKERIGSTGEIIVPLEAAALAPLAEKLKALGIEAVAIFFMNSYANPQHEESAAQELRRLLPDAYVTCSTELTREWYEYERTSTVAANAYVGPQVSTYVRRLHSELAAKGFGGSLFMMGSNGGLLSVDRTCRQPVNLVESGPIGGCIGAAAYAEALGCNNVIAFDMGGTTAKCALVENGRFSVDSIYYAGGYVKGFPIKSSVIDIVEVGSGGGSIAWLDAQKRLHVGPKSAGSTPGPACYGQGGREPTVTDANLVLGRLNAERFLGGEMKLDVAAAERALAERIGEPLGLSAVEAADGILRIAATAMSYAVKGVTTERGFDAGDFALFAYGGAGPLHAVEVAREIGMGKVIVPLAPGVFSAFGMLFSDLRYDFVRTWFTPLEDAKFEQIEKVYRALEQQGRDAIAGTSVKPQKIAIKRSADMRYVGQEHAVTVDLPMAVFARKDRNAIKRHFDAMHAQRYGTSAPAERAEIVSLRSTVTGLMRKPPQRRIARGGRMPAKAASNGKRNVYYGGHFHMTPTYRRDTLVAGNRIKGPALIEEYASTTVLMPGDAMDVDALGNLVIAVGGR